MIRARLADLSDAHIGSGLIGFDGGRGMGELVEEKLARITVRSLKREFEIVESVFLFFFFKFLELNRVNIECTRFFL